MQAKSSRLGSFSGRFGEVAPLKMSKAFLRALDLTGNSSRPSPVVHTRGRQFSSRHVAHVEARPTINTSPPSPHSEILDSVIVGGGLSGLSIAQYLAKDTSRSFVLTEARDRVGGNITTVSFEGFQWEEGPNSFQPSDAMLQLALDAGCEQELVFGDPKAPRFVYWEGRLRDTPSGLDALTFDLLSPLGKLRAGLGALGLRPPAPEAVEETIEQFARRNLGDEAYYRLVEPACAGVYAGDPRELSMKAAFPWVHALETTGGSLVGGAIRAFKDRRANPSKPLDPRVPVKPKGPTVGSFRKGIKTLPEKIHANLKDQIKLGWKLTSIQKNTQGILELRYDTPEGARTLRARTMALTVPAYVAADLFRVQSPRAAEALASFDYPPVAAVTLAYPMASIHEARRNAEGRLEGFGQLHPRNQGIVTLGTIYSSSLFPGRCPEGFQVVLCFLGGATNRGVLQQSEEELAEQAERDLRQTQLIKGEAPRARVLSVRLWPKAIPQFQVGHFERIEAARKGLQEAGLGDVVLLSGNYISGVSLGNCIENGLVCARDIDAKVNELVKK